MATTIFDRTLKNKKIAKCKYIIKINLTDKLPT